MEEKRLTVAQCEELVEALREAAASLPRGSERDHLLELAEGYRVLAVMKRIALRKVN